MSTIEVVNIGITSLTLMASIATAIVAYKALSAWREQLAGASQHELAKKLSGALRQLAIARCDSLRNLRAVYKMEEGIGHELGGHLAEELLPENAIAVDEAAKLLSSLEGEVAVLWGDDMFNLVSTIRGESTKLAIFLKTRRFKAKGAREFAQMIVYASPFIAPSYHGGTYEYALDELTKLAQEWVGGHIGREGLSLMSASELRTRRLSIDKDVGRMSDAEKIEEEKTQNE